MKTAINDDPLLESDDLPASPQLSVDLNNDPFSTFLFDATDELFGQPDNIVNMFTKLDLETSAATDTLKEINSQICLPSFLSEEPPSNQP